MTFLLIIINIVIFILINTNKLDVNKMDLSYYGVSVSKQYYRLISNGFVHANFSHIACNMYSLFNIGRTIEYLYGSIRYLVIYFVILIAGSLLSILVKHNNRRDYDSSIGASGVICGLIGIYFVKIFLVFGLAGIRSLLPSLIPMIIMSLMPGVDLYGHLFGFVVGGLIGFIL